MLSLLDGENEGANSVRPTALPSQFLKMYMGDTVLIRKTVFSRSAISSEFIGEKSYNSYVSTESFSMTVADLRVKVITFPEWFRLETCDEFIRLDVGGFTARVASLL
jgi:hypothetical protein